MKTSTTKTTFFNRVANGDLSNKDQVTIFVIGFAILLTCVLLFGHPYQAYYYSK